MRNFTNRHRELLRFALPTRQEASRFRACNADTPNTHLATLDKIITDNSIDAERLWNLDETGATPGKDANGKKSAPAYMTRDGLKTLELGTF